MNWKVLIVGILAVALLLPVSAAAQTPDRSNIGATQSFIQIGDNQAVVTFAELGYQQTDLVSPFDSTRVFFSIPANWRLSQGGQVELNFDTLLSGADANKVDATNYGGVLTITFNGKLVDTVRLDQTGNRVLRFDLPADALVSTRQDGRHELDIALTAQFSCKYDLRTVVTIRTASLFDLPFQTSSPVLNLSTLPQPFFLRDSLVPDRTLVVIPDNPAKGEMQAALDVVAGFGSLIGTGFNFDLLPLSQVTPDLLTSTNLIFVGQPGAFPQLSDIQFPTAVKDGKFTNLQPEAADDGVVELAVSPWNASKVVMLVSGDSEAAVVKGAQAVSSGKIFIFDNPAVANVKDVQSFASSLPIVEDFSAKDLGYDTQTISGVGVNSAEISFYVSKEQVGTKDAYVDLAYYHSGLLDYGASSLTVSLNDQIIASAAFTKESEQLTTQRMVIPPGVLRFGTNRLSISTKLLPVFACDTSGVTDPWLAISNLTGLHIPVTPASSPNSPLLDLRFYPSMFMTRSDLGDVAFVLPRSDPETWQVAANLAYDLGRTANPTVANLQMAYADDPVSDVQNNSSLIVVGRASTLPLLADFNDMLPAPFDLKNDTAEETNMQIVYRIPPGVSVGYLELLASPYNSQKAVMVVSGNDAAGLSKSQSALLVGELRSQLAGLFAVTNGTQVATRSTNSIYSVVGTVVPGLEPVVATPISGIATEPAPAYARPVWLMPLIIVSIVGIVLLMIIVSISAIARNRARAEVSDNDKTARKTKQE